MSCRHQTLNKYNKVGHNHTFEFLVHFWKSPHFYVNGVCRADGLKVDKVPKCIPTLHTHRFGKFISGVRKLSPLYPSHPSALHGWLSVLLRWGLPRFTAHNCLPLHGRRFSKYDSLILMCLGKHKANTNASLHAWANHCRCCLIISPTCTLNRSVNSGTFSSPPLCPSADQRGSDWWRLQLLFSRPGTFTQER